MLISGAPVGTFRDGDGDVARRAAAKKASGDGFPDVLAMQMGLDVLEAHDGFGVERKQNVSDHHASIMSGAAGLDFQHDSGSFFPSLERFSEILGEANRLQAYAEVATGDAALREERVHHAVHRGDGQGEGSRGSEFWSGDAGDPAVSIDHSAADSRVMKSDVQTNVGREREAAPEAALVRNHADEAQRSDGAAGTGASYDESDVAGMKRCGIAERRNDRVRLLAPQDGNVSGRVAAH